MEAVVTPALLARSVNYGEADRICTLLTRSLGKLSVIARSARKSRRRFGGALGLFVIGEASLRPPRRGAELYTLERFSCLEDLAPAISADVVKVAHGSYMLEVCRELWPPDLHEPALYQLIVEALAALGRHPPSEGLLRAFELRCLSIAGFLPSLDLCASCGRSVPATEGALGFAVAAGGVICSACGPHGWPVSPAALAELRLLVERPMDEAARASLPAGVGPDLRHLTQMVLQHQLGKVLRSREFLEQLAGVRAGD